MVKLTDEEKEKRKLAKEARKLVDKQQVKEKQAALARMKAEGKPLTPVKIGRPKAISPEWMEYICDQIAEGRSLWEICHDPKVPHVPAYSVVRYWARKDPIFSADYLRAREAQQESLAEKALSIASGKHPDAEEMDANERRVWIDTIKWSAGKLLSSRYGDKIALTGADGGPIQMEARRVDVAQLEDDEREMLEQTMRRLIESQAK